MNRNYDKDHCWQYEMKLKTLKDDKEELDMSKEYIKNLRVSDFEFEYVSNERYDEIEEFILRYEWLGTMPPYPTHFFIAKHRGELASVLIYTMPNAFSKYLGEKTKDIERLLARGASASWTPKNLASAMIAWSTDYMAKNTQYRMFSAYSDPTAKELGTVYQASNWIYLGQTFGGTRQYREPNSDKWTSDRRFRNLNSFKKYAKEMGIDWDESWSEGRRVLWENMPEGLEGKLREMGRQKISECEVRDIPPKHKYVEIKGPNKRETRKLKREFYERNPNFKDIPYPKNRGEW